MSGTLDRAWMLVLAGGKGTRLAAAVPNRPKVLAPVGDRPFLDILLERLHGQGLRRVALLLGVHHQQVLDHLAGGAVVPPGMEVATVVEDQPLGTAGALKLAAAFCKSTFLVANGDTYLDLDAAALWAEHQRVGALATLAGMHVPDGGRYGTLEIDGDGRLGAFREKDAAGRPGLISGGVYVMEPALLDLIPAGRAVSLEQEVFPAAIAAGHRLQVVPQTGRFFDIGTEASWQDFVRFAGPARRDEDRRTQAGSIQAGSTITGDKQ